MKTKKFVIVEDLSNVKYSDFTKLYFEGLHNEYCNNVNCVINKETMLFDTKEEAQHYIDTVINKVNYSNVCGYDNIKFYVEEVELTLPVTTPKFMV